MIDATARQLDEPPETTSAADADTIANVVSNSRRRHALEYIAQAGATTLNDITDYVTRQEQDGDYTGTERKSVYVTLYQLHLEALEDAGAIVRKDRGHRVIPGPNLQALVAAATHVEMLGGDEQ